MRVALRDGLENNGIQGVQIAIPPVQLRLLRKYNSISASLSRYRTTALHCSQ